MHKGLKKVLVEERSLLFTLESSTNWLNVYI